MHTVIFDCDGVLVDSEPLTAQVLCDSIAEFGLEFAPAEALDFIRGRKVATWVAELEEMLGEPLGPEFVPRFRRHCLTVYDQRLRAVPGVEPVLRELRLPHCVASSAPREKVEHTLRLTGLLRYFTGRLHSAYEVGVWKPDPGLFLHAATAMGAAPGDCAVIEDSLPGVRAGIRAGMTVFGYAPAGTAPELEAAGAVVFRAMEHLPHLLAAWRSGAPANQLKESESCDCSGKATTTA